MKEFILIIDDDKDICKLLGIYLGNEGYRYLACENARKAMDVLEHYQVDLILLDVMMPGIDGISACLKIRETNKMPIIFMSAKSEDMDIIQGLTAGGDDYVTKPFKPIELLTRIKAQLRRYKQYNEAKMPTHTLQADDLTVDTKSRLSFPCYQPDCTGCGISAVLLWAEGIFLSSELTAWRCRRIPSYCTNSSAPSGMLCAVFFCQDQPQSKVC